MNKRTIIIGGGVAGLAAAIRLQADGHQTVVLEKNARAGGKLNRREGKGYIFDTGPSILTMPWVLEQLFASAGRNLHDYVTLTRVEPQWRTWFEDGTTLDVQSDLPGMLAEIEKCSPTDRERFLDYLTHSHRMYELSMKSFYKESLSGLPDLRKRHSLKELLEMDPLRSMAQNTASYLRHDKLQQLFNFFMMYIGSSPYAAPAVLSQLIYVQLGLGIYYVQGGMARLADAMVQLLEELGGEIRLSCEVESIVSDPSASRAIGVQLADGDLLQGARIVCNQEVVTAHETLLDAHPQAKGELRKLAKFAPTVSGHVLLLGVNRTYPQLAHHNFFFAGDQKREFRELFEQKKLVDDPTIYVGISSKSDPTQAPAGKENWFVLTHVPPLAAGERWEPNREQYRELVLSKLERMGVHGLRNHIEYEQQFTPDDLKQLYGANGGSIYGVVTDRKLNGGFKIPSRSPLLDNLYFVGGSTHPGGGVPMVALSGQLTADLIREDIRKLAAI